MNLKNAKHDIKARGFKPYWQLTPKKESKINNPIWLQFGLDTELEQVLILGVCSDRYMVAKRNAELMLPDKPILVVNAREKLVDIWAQLAKFLTGNDFPAEKLPLIADTLLPKLKNIFEYPTCEESNAGTTSVPMASTALPVKLAASGIASSVISNLPGRRF